MSGNPMMNRLRQMTGKGKKSAGESATDVEEPAAKATESPAEPAAEPAAPAKSAGKSSRPSVLERMKAGKSGKKGKAPASQASSPSSEPSPDSINPPKKGGRAKSATAPATPSTQPDSPKTAPPAKAAAKSSKGKKATKTDGKTTLLIGCYPTQGLNTVAQLHELLADVKQAVCEAHGVDHWGLVEYGKSGPALAHALDAKLTEEGVPGILYTEPFSSETHALEQVLAKHYEVVIRGVR